MQPVQLYLFGEGAEASNLKAAIDLSSVVPNPQHSDNLLIQELMDAGAWANVELLEDARAVYRKEVMECRFVQDSFIAHESKVALKLVTERIKDLT